MSKKISIYLVLSYLIFLPVRMQAQTTDSIELTKKATVQDASSSASVPAVDQAKAAVQSDTGTETKSAVKTTLAKKALGTVVGAVVGTPVCVVRKSIDEEKYGVEQLVGGTDNKRSKFAARAFWLPFALVTGSLEAPFASAKNSLRCDKAFSGAQFSLRDVKPKAQSGQ